MDRQIVVLKQRKVFSTAIAIMVTLGGLSFPTVGYSGPAMYWWHKVFPGNQSQCVTKARHIMPGHDNKPSGAFYSTSDITAVVKCIKQAGKPLAVLIVTGNSRDKAKRTFDGLRKRMFD